MKNILMILDNGHKPDVRVAKEIRTLNKLGIKVKLVCWDQDTDLPVNESFELLTIKRIKIKAKRQEGIKKIKDLIKFYDQTIKLLKVEKENFDFIYVHDFLLLPLGVLLKIRTKNKLIYDAHEIYHLMEYEKYNYLLRQLMFLIEKVGLWFVDSFIVVSKNREEFYAKYVKNNIWVLGNWFEHYDGPFVDIKEELNIPVDNIVIGYFGGINIKARKLDKLIELTKNISNAHLIMAGFGADQETIKNLVNNEKRIHYLGWKQNIRQYLQSVDFICYFLSQDRVYFNYAAPNTIYLSLSHDIPLITNVPGEPQTLIEEYDIGYFVSGEIEKANNYIKFDKQSQSYLNKVKNIKKIKEKFSWDQSLTIYKEMLNI